MNPINSNQSTDQSPLTRQSNAQNTSEQSNSGVQNAANAISKPLARFFSQNLQSFKSTDIITDRGPGHKDSARAQHLGFLRGIGSRTEFSALQSRAAWTSQGGASANRPSAPVRQLSDPDLQSR